MNTLCRVAIASSLLLGLSSVSFSQDHEASLASRWSPNPKSLVSNYFRPNSDQTASDQPVESTISREPNDGLSQAIGQALSATSDTTGSSAAAAEAGDNGTNPASNMTTAIIANSFFQLDGGNKINTTFFRLKYPVLDKKGGFLVEIPFQYLDLTNPLAVQAGGLGDLKFQFSYNLFTNPCRKTTFITYNELYIPSADNVLLTGVPDSNQFISLELGSGKFVFGQGVGMVWHRNPASFLLPCIFTNGTLRAAVHIRISVAENGESL